MKDAEPACDDTGICRPFDDDSTVCNCVYCGKELVKVGREWRTWDWEYFQRRTTT